MILSIGSAALAVGVSISTLRRWEAQGICVPSFRTPGGHRRYHSNELTNLTSKNPFTVENESKKVYAYARVSSHDQKTDLMRQEDRLRLYCESQNVNEFDLISDLGSGINYKKKGLKKLLKAIIHGQVSKLILTHKDRLLRFGSPLVFTLCDFFGCAVTILEEQAEHSFEQEHVSDVIEIMSVFTAKLYGKRSHKNKNICSAQLYGWPC